MSNVPEKKSCQTFKRNTSARGCPFVCVEIIIARDDISATSRTSSGPPPPRIPEVKFTALPFVFNIFCLCCLCAYLERNLILTVAHSITEQSIYIRANTGGGAWISLKIKLKYNTDILIKHYYIYLPLRYKYEWDF